MGIQINGSNDTIQADDGSLSLAGSVSYEDVTNVTSVGLSTFSSGIHIDDSITHLGDTDTKIRFPAADTVTVETGGNERVRITSAGDFGIGVTPVVKFHLKLDTDKHIRFQGNIGEIGSVPGFQGVTDAGALAGLGLRGSDLRFATGSSERMRIDSAGNLGINNAAPSQRVHVGGNIEFNAHDSNNGNGGYYTAKGLIIGNAYDAGKGSSVTDDRNAIIWQERGLDLDFATNNTLKMKLTYDGKLGLGTQSPASKLHVANSSSAQIELILDPGPLSSEVAYINSYRTNSPLGFKAGDTERMRIDSSGNLIVGTTTAATNAEVTVRAASPQLSLYATPGNTTRVTLGDTDDYDIGQIGYDNSDNSMFFATNAATRMSIDSSGRLLVGATSAATAGSLAQYAKFVLRGDTGSASSAGIINLARGTGAASMSSGFSAGVISFSDNAGLEFGDIGFNADGAPSGSSTPGRFVIKTTASGATTPTERMRITHDGRVNIGGNFGQSTFPIQFTGTTDVLCIKGSGNNAFIRFQDVDSTADFTFGSDDGPASGSFIIYDRNANAYRLQLDSSGYFHIGNTVSSLNTNRLLQIGDTSRSATYIEVRTSTSGAGGIVFADGTSANNSGYRGTMEYAHSTDRMFFKTAGTDKMTINANGQFFCGGVYSYTSSNAANVFVFSDGLLVRSTSSIKYKTDIETLQDSYADNILNCRPVWYRSNSSVDNKDWGYWGFIAEEVAEIDPRLVNWKTTDLSHDENGAIVETPCDPEREGVQYDRFVPHLVNLIKRQQQEIETLKTEVAALKAG